MTTQGEKPIYEFWAAAQDLRNRKSKNSLEDLEKQVLLAILEDRHEDVELLMEKLKKRNRFSVAN
ncbi:MULTISPECIES: hypothetical protein [Acidithiobacillus]|jgi:hypothetical protein|uniref:hypothetical protein n=1 Tax=Acidithiobacillus TaxID=119977 RepID=UPI0004E1C64A|nr:MULTISPECIES: hypothetical protein [Acidithiobacillus]MDD5278733.1 hypothetical protein [Acidithiobacillus sp.]